jgi:hypothetical protein
VLEKKLAVIFEEFGIDKTGDVLDSALSGAIFDEVFTSAITNPEAVVESVDRAAERIRSEIESVCESSAIYGVSDVPDRNAAEELRSHPLPYWIERMTVSYINSQGGSAIKRRGSWELQWPGGSSQVGCVFHSCDLDSVRNPVYLSLENPRVRGLAVNLPQIVEGQRIPHIATDKLPSGISGDWGLFEIRLHSQSVQSEMLRIPPSKRAFLCVFVSDEGRLYLPTARHIWDTLLATSFQTIEIASQAESHKAFQSLQAAAEAAGQQKYEMLRSAHEASVAREEERGRVSLDFRRNAIGKIGLPEVRTYRLDRCNADEAQWRRELSMVRETVPELRPLLILRVTREEPTS